MHTCVLATWPGRGPLSREPLTLRPHRIQSPVQVGRHLITHHLKRLALDHGCSFCALKLPKTTNRSFW